MFWCLESVSFVFTEKFQNLDLSQKYQDFLKVILNFLILRLVHVVRDFRPWDVITKVRYFLMAQIYNLRTLEVELDLE